MVIPVPDFPEYDLDYALAVIRRKVNSIGWRSGEGPEQATAAKTALGYALAAVQLSGDPAHWADLEYNIEDSSDSGCLVMLRLRVATGDGTSIRVFAQAQIYPAMANYPGEWQPRWVAFDPIDELPPVLFSVHWDGSEMSVAYYEGASPFDWPERHQ